MPATIVGTARSQFIRGTSGPDVIVGLEGRDIILGLGGDDVICGGAGDDMLVGGSGNDFLDGGDGRDWLGGDAGDDTLKGGPDADYLLGGWGTDALDGGPDRDACLAGGRGDPTPMACEWPRVSPQPLDSYLAIDATGSMGAPPCTPFQAESGCPIKEAKDAAAGFVDVLLDGGQSTGYSQVGVGAFRGCYNPPRSVVESGTGRQRCITASEMVHDLSTSKTDLTSTISGIWAIGHTAGSPPLQPSGGTGTNVCVAMHQGNETLFGASGQTASNTMKIFVLLSDGDNTYAGSIVYDNDPLSPPTECRPASGYTSNDPYLGDECFTSRYLHAGYYTYDYNNQTREKNMDMKTRDYANWLKAQGVEIYAVGFGVCGDDDGWIRDQAVCDSSAIGNNDPDYIADRRLLKCIASSSPGTNDHYFEAPTAGDLPGVYNQIARGVASRLIR